MKTYSTWSKLSVLYKLLSLAGYACDLLMTIYRWYHTGIHKYLCIPICKLSMVTTNLRNLEQKCTLANQFRCICMTQFDPCVLEQRCLFQPMDASHRYWMHGNKTAQKYHCMERLAVNTLLPRLHLPDHCTYVMFGCDILCLQYPKVRHACENVSFSHI